MSKSNQSLRTIFNEAVEIADARQRSEYLSQACGDDTVLRQRIEELIAANNEAGRFLGSAGDTGHPIDPDDAPGGTALLAGILEESGDKVGRYKLLQKIGEGGCGVVYMAEQEEPVRRRVALKVIKLGMDTKSVIARFEAERQALALMDHPNIAKVLDAGATEAGRPYFVMELVKGVRITDYCDQNNLSTRQRLDLFTLVCHAIQHAHQKGIIHRDIKPSNILVTLHDSVPVPKVIDFGIAKATDRRLTDKTVFTEFQALMGTPAYMSPEQAEMNGLDIDTRSDIYALGVLLYELLTGKTPFDGKELLAAGLDAMRRTIREQEPAKPSTRLSTMLAADLTSVAEHRQSEAAKLTSLLRGDLDWIVMKALEKDRTRRYDTANAFALDIRSFLADEPVSAAAPSAAYRFGKFARRNKVALAVAAAFAALLIVATVASSWQAIRASRAEALSQKRLLEVAAERDAKDKARQDAEAISTFLSEVFSSPDPARDGRTITVAETLDRAAKKLETDLTTQPEHRARLQLSLGTTYRALGLAGQAIPLQEKALDSCLTTFGLEHPNTIMVMNELANSYFDAGRRDEALQLREQVLPLRRKVLGPEHPSTLGEMSNLASSYADAGRRDDALKLREEVLALDRKILGVNHPDTLSAMHNLASSYFDAGRRDEALQLREQVLTLRRKVLGPVHPDALAAMNNLANSYSEAGRRDEALKLREEVLALDLKIDGPEHPYTLGEMSNLANSYSEAGRRDEALKLREEVLSLDRKIDGPEHPDTLSAMHNLANSYFDVGRWDEALKLREQVLELRRKVLGREHLGTLMAMNHLASSYSQAARWDEAVKLGEQELLLRRKVLGPENPDTLTAMNDLANSYAAAGRRDEAIELGEETLTLQRGVLGPENPDTLVTMNQLANYYDEDGRRAEALKLREETLALFRKVNGPEHPDTLAVSRNLAMSYADAGRGDEARKLREETLALRRKVLGPEHLNTLEAMNDLVSSYCGARRWVEACELLEEKVRISRKVLGPEHLDTLTAMANLASCYGNAGQRAEALKLQEETLTLHRKVVGAEHPSTLGAMSNLARSYADAGRRDEALKLREEVVTLSRKAPGPKHPNTLRAILTLAEFYRAEGNHAASEPLMLEYNESVQQSPQCPPTEKRGAMVRLRNFYIDWAVAAPAAGKMDKASEWGKKLTEFDERAQQTKARSK